MDRALRYVVTAELPSEQVQDEYLRWLRDGHAQAVVEGGALSAEILILDGDGWSVATSYTFASRAAFACYEVEVAPALRADGVATFVDVHGVRFSRSLGEISDCYVEVQRNAGGEHP